MPFYCELEVRYYGKWDFILSVSETKTKEIINVIKSGPFVYNHHKLVECSISMHLFMFGCKPTYKKYVGVTDTPNCIVTHPFYLEFSNWVYFLIYLLYIRLLLAVNDELDGTFVLSVFNDFVNKKLLLLEFEFWVWSRYYNIGSL